MARSTPYKVNDVDKIFVETPEASDFAFAYVVQPSALHAGVFATVSDAIDAARADGASTANPKVILIEGGNYTEDFTIYDGIFLQAAGGRGGSAGEGSVIFNESSVTVDGSAIACGISGCVFLTAATANTIIQTGVPSSTDLRIENCDIEQTGGGTAVSFGGNSLQVVNSLIEGAIGIDLSLGQLVVQLSAIVSLGTCGINIQTGTTFVTIAFTEVDSIGGTCIAKTGSAVVTVVDSIIGQFSTSSNGISIVGTQGSMTVANVLFNVAVGASNRAISGQSGSVLNWGGLTFLPSTNKKVATTTMGASAVHMVVDSITAV